MSRDRYDEHEAGWRVVLDGAEVAQLDFVRIDPPFYLFRPVVETKDEAKIEYSLRRTTSRAPEDRLLFRCRRFDAVATDADFFVSLHDDGIVSVRDMRPPVSR